MTRASRPKQLWEPGLIPAPGALLDWRDARHHDARTAYPCTLCGHPTHLRSHTGEPAHKTCAETWIATHYPEARRTARFASDPAPARRSHADTDHA
ncbi:hypothetical protein [Streptomyces sp. NPDC001054]